MSREVNEIVKSTKNRVQYGLKFSRVCLCDCYMSKVIIRVSKDVGVGKRALTIWLSDFFCFDETELEENFSVGGARVLQ